MSNKEQNGNFAKPMLPAVFCHVCGREVKLTKDGRYRRHGYKRSYASRNYYGVPYESGYSGVETKNPCLASGELPLP
jgi:hypothetical protein